MRIRTTVGELYVEEVGEGTPVVLWHSFLHHGGMWKGQLAALAAHHRVINIDAPGHGRSSVLDRPIVMADCARAVIEVMDARSIPRAAMAGLSWGGMVAMEAAVARPDRISRIALFDTSCRAEPRRNRLKYRALATILKSIGPVPLLLDRVEPLFFAEHTVRYRRDVIEPWRAYVSRMDRGSVWHALHCIMDRTDLTAALRRLDVPALVAVGAYDRAQPVRESEWIASALPRAELAIIPEAGHLAAVENAAAVNAVLLPFLSRAGA